MRTTRRCSVQRGQLPGPSAEDPGQPGPQIRCRGPPEPVPRARGVGDEVSHVALGGPVAYGVLLDGKVRAPCDIQREPGKVRDSRPTPVPTLTTRCRVSA